MLRPVRAIVVEADYLGLVILAYESSVVLKTKLGIFWNFEGTVFSVQLPYDISIRAIYLVNATGVSCRY